MTWRTAVPRACQRRTSWNVEPRTGQLARSRVISRLRNVTPWGLLLVDMTAGISSLSSARIEGVEYM